MSPEMSPEEHAAVDAAVRRHTDEREAGRDVPGYRITAADPDERRAQWDELLALLDGGTQAA
ncbi:hypothetical protein [Nocardiopsis baichengensis]|uniref:hypothetical protein n=1 Tax=Nocardiopsis baichengensis TaxID=280240 RepID=UPI00034B58C9|nr:hypothetical protein [Nocardiopsis baichengensis]